MFDLTWLFLTFSCLTILFYLIASYDLIVLYFIGYNLISLGLNSFFGLAPTDLVYIFLVRLILLVESLFEIFSQS